MGILKIATYNIWGFNEPWHYTLKRGIVRGAVPGSIATTSRDPDIWARRCQLIVQALNEMQPDIIGLQEVQVFPDQSGRHQAEQIAYDLGYRCAFVPLHENNQEGFVQGLAVLTRYEIKKMCAIHMPVVGMALHAIIAALPGRLLHLVICHLAAHHAEARQVAIKHILTYLSTLPADQPQIVVGDFNALPESPTIEYMRAAGRRDVWREVHPADGGPTMPGHSPVSRLDYIFIDNSFRVLAVQRFGTRPDEDGFYPSDHLGVATTLHCF